MLSELSLSYYKLPRKIVPRSLIVKDWGSIKEAIEKHPPNQDPYESFTAETSMKVTQEKLPDSQIGLEIEIPAEISKNTYEKVVRNLARTANIPGFRKGKVPRSILMQRLGTRNIKAATLEELIQQSVKDAIKQESIESIGNYRLRSNFEELVEQFNPETGLTFSASVDVPPSVELGDYATLSVKAEEIAYDPEKVENWLKEQQEKKATLVPVEDRGAQMGDIVIVDYQGRYTDETDPIEGVQGTDFKVEMEEGRLIAGLVEGMVGMKPEESKEISVTFPEDYPQGDLAGKPVIFSITLKEIKAKELPELDDDFAEEVSEFETIAELRESLEKRFQEQAQNGTKNNIQNAIIENLVKISTVDVPETLVQEEVTQVLMQTATQLEQMGVELRTFFTQENLPRMRENARPEAIERLKQSLVVEELSKLQDVAIEEEAIAERSQKIREQLATQRSDSEIDEDRLQEVVTRELKIEKVLDWLQEQVTVELVPEGSLNPPEIEEPSETVEATTSEEE